MLLNRIYKKQQNRTITVLHTLSLVFCLSWLPFSLLGITTEITNLHTNSGV